MKFLMSSLPMIVLALCVASGCGRYGGKRRYWMPDPQIEPPSKVVPYKTARTLCDEELEEDRLCGTHLIDRLTDIIEGPEGYCATKMNRCMLSQGWVLGDK